MNVSLTPELERFIEDKVRSGRYQTASEVVREALRLLENHDKSREAWIADLNKKIKVGLDQLARGEHHSGDEVYRELKAKNRARRAKAK